MRYFDIEALSVETAGQSGMGSLVRLCGIKNGRAFRDAVLSQRDSVVGSQEESGGVQVVDGDGSIKLLTEIRDSLVRLESKLGNN